MLATNLAVCIEPLLLIDEHLLCSDGAVVYAEHFHDARNPPRPIRQTRRLDDHMQRTTDDLVQRIRWELSTSHGDHGHETLQRIFGRVCVKRAHRPFMTGVHRLQHIERFSTADLADHNSVRAHSQCVLHQVANGDLAAPFHIGRPALQAHRVRPL